MENSKLASILSYFFIGIIWYLIDDNLKKDDNVKFHVKQGIVLTVASIVGNVVLSIIIGILPFLYFVSSLFSLVILGLAIYGVINANKGELTPLPVIGQYADKINI